MSIRGCVENGSVWAKGSSDSPLYHNYQRLHDIELPIVRLTQRTSCILVRQLEILRKISIINKFGFGENCKANCISN